MHKILIKKYTLIIYSNSSIAVLSNPNYTPIFERHINNQHPKTVQIRLQLINIVSRRNRKPPGDDTGSGTAVLIDAFFFRLHLDRVRIDHPHFGVVLIKRSQVDPDLIGIGGSCDRGR